EADEAGGEGGLSFCGVRSRLGSGALSQPASAAPVRAMNHEKSLSSIRTPSFAPQEDTLAAMIEWSETHLAIRDAFRRFVEAEIKPNLEALEHGDTPPYAVLRKMVETFGLADMARANFARELAREPGDGAQRERKPSPMAGDALAMQMIPIIE